MRPFLRGARVALHPTPAGAPAGPDAWLDPGPQGPARDEVLLALRPPPADAEAGVVGLVSLDWRARSARLCAGGPGLDAEELAEAVALVTRYAFDELNLERVEAAPARAQAVSLLLGTGLYRAQDGGWLVARRADATGPR